MDLRSLPPSGVLSLCLCGRERVAPPFQDVALSAVAPAPDTPAGHWLASLETVGEGCMPSSHNHHAIGTHYILARWSLEMIGGAIQTFCHLPTVCAF